MTFSPKFAILGAGSIGTYIGAHLLKAGYPVVFVGRERLKQEVQLFGLGISDFEGNSFSLPPDSIEYVTSTEEAKDCNIFLVTVKSKDTADLSRSLSELLTGENRKNAIFVSFQNGVRNAQELASALPDCQARVLAGMVPFNVVSQGKGKFHRGTSGELVLEKNEAGDKVLSYLKKAGLSAISHRNMPGVLWGKLLINLNNSLNALAGVPLREELSQRGYRKILSAMISEGIEVLKAADIHPARAGKMIPQLAPIVLKLPDFLFFAVASSMVKIDPEARSSMWEDLHHGRKTEIDYLNGEILNLADRFGHPATINRKIASLISEAENRTEIKNHTADSLSRELGLS
ncbi:2-dehydropantoate 2-reductase [Leptospira wolffii]|uniref:2-dehydropantoate 2-reductase n=1 Tax=Leptospira wolffii TaxID=409998 RepID=A0A2M9ZFU5_9LEPT|nr:2-dehydropantoate 2-reductase [Leptospira wolffii]PJZ67217.1 2-dehydropantoate 2-reductase [Leptospira wolffii]TGK62207.1 2-dehydropantoate 2-reductase [Leptospira wolffii]TGK66578.1 2-dehydropantoate 2-reductase [Leptospira wolffii]TGK74409.1 2-dehydropantoate 2-reductase [Leptospira wolffii]TGL32016.1 2-dehydropantoate 2-reductase [Leptospira wolffii]